MDAAHVHVFLADDDTDDCDLFKEALDSLPVSVSLTAVNDGEQLIRALTQKFAHLPDLIFLDLDMPNMNGKECLKEIKRNHLLKHLPVVMLSGSLDNDSMLELYEIGAKSCVRKPIGFGNLKDLILHALSAEISLLSLAF